MIEQVGQVVQGRQVVQGCQVDQVGLLVQEVRVEKHHHLVLVDRGLRLLQGRQVVQGVRVVQKDMVGMVVEQLVHRVQR